MAVRRKSNQYIIEFMFKGRRVFKRVPRAATKAQALEYEAALKREIFDTNVLNKQLKVTIREALDKWLESIEGRKAFKQTKSHALNAAQIVGTHSLGAIADSAEELRRASAVRGWQAGTLNRRLAVLKALAKFAWRKGWLQENLSGKIAQVREGPGRQTHLTREQIDALIKATPERSQAYVALAVYTGLRQGLVLSLTLQSFSGGALQLPDSKGGIPLGIPLIPAAKPFLAALPFTLHKRTYYADFEKARKAIGMPNLWYHDLRHTTASLMAQAGVPLYTIGEILGHKSIQTTKRYAHLRLEDKRRALEEAFKDAA